MGEFIKKGTLIRHFTIIEKIDSGGMAHVYRAFDKKLRRDVAIKTIREDKVEAETVKRFVSEARSLAQLSHTNITAVYDIDKIEDNYYLFLEYIDGINLKEFIKNEEMKFGEFLKMARELASAFRYVHKKGILHRDIKPANIIYTKDGSFKIIDFGISKWEDDPNSHKTKTNFFVGSLRYLAPEVFFNARASIKSDVYGLGMTLLYVLLARPYISGKTSEEIIRNVAQDDGVLPPTLEKNLPDEFIDLLFYLIEKDPVSRCEDMEEVVRILDNLTPQVSNSLKDKTLTEIRAGHIEKEDTRIMHRSVSIPKSKTLTSKEKQVLLETYEKHPVVEELKIPSIPLPTEKSQELILDEEIVEEFKNDAKQVEQKSDKKENRKPSKSHSTDSKIQIAFNNLSKSIFSKVDMLKVAVFCFFMFLGTLTYVFVFSDTKKQVKVDSFNQKVDFELKEKRVSLEDNRAIRAKSNNQTIATLLNQLNPTNDPKLYKSIKDLDDMFVMANSKSVEFNDIKKRKMSQLQSLVDNKRNELAYKKANEINRELMNRIFDIESQSVRGTLPNRLPANRSNR
jgi:serine/threonine protein kinase